MAYGGRTILKDEDVHINSGTIKELDKTEGTMVSRAFDIDRTTTMKEKMVQTEVQKLNY